ncbi:UDP-glycosyltransferase UGT5-like isoform X23 [Planococcus citri]|uniref:UDP-glycosyltransferase UGT5-like isoform X23 n=1 Tax=Planococcus citri TaxID=170843 RepID=UPI0031F83B7C
MKIVIILSCLCYWANGANILCFFPIPFRSSFVFVKPLLVELANRGHNLTVYTMYPDHSHQSIKYRQIDMRPCTSSQQPPKQGTMDDIMASDNIMSTLKMAYNFQPKSSKEFLKCSSLDQLFNSRDQFDLFLTSITHYDWFAGFAYKFGCPMINVYHNMILPWVIDSIGAVSNPAFVPIVQSGVSPIPSMYFGDRLFNTYYYLMMRSIGSFYTTIPAEKFAREVFGDEMPSLEEIVRNTSVTLFNNYPGLHAVLPMPPNLIAIGGMNVGPAEILPQNIEKFINESKHGVVYFCMGSLLRGETFPPEKREAFLYAFSKIPQRVLWKWEGDVLPGKSDNIMISKWMPQRDILAHPNVKLFISHGGLLGTSEAVYEGVPVLGIPIFGDQRTNIKSLEANGAGELLDYNEISKEVVLEKIQRLLNDPKYKENAKLLSDRYRDRPMSPLDTAVYWTEYVIRHKGAPHLRTAAADMPWYQYLLLDVIAFIVAVLVAGLLIIYYTTKFILRAIYGLICGGGAKKGSSKSDKKKRN